MHLYVGVTPTMEQVVHDKNAQGDGMAHSHGNAEGDGMAHSCKNDEFI